MLNKTIGLVFATSFLSIPVFASDFYILGNYSQNNFKIGDSGESAHSHVYQSSELILIKDSNSSISVGAGYQINDNVSFELSYNDLGSSTLKDIVTAHSSDGLTKYGETIYYTSGDWSSVQTSIVVKRALTDSLQLYGRIGTAKITKEYETRKASPDGDYIYGGTESIRRGLFGIGLGYKFNERILFRVEYDRYLSSSREYIYTNASLGIVYSF